MEVVYPNGAKKALTLRFDDGAVSDRQMVKLLNNYKLKATFYPIAKYISNDGFVTKEEFRTLYDGHEIGNHTYSHIDPRCNEMTSAEVKAELEKGKETLKTIWDGKIEGYAYVCSSYGNTGEEEYKKILAETGHKYAIMGRENYSFEPNINDRFDVGHSFRFSDDALIEKAKEYTEFNAEKLSLFFTMAHSYEFDLPQYDYGWNKVEEFFGIISNRDDIWYATNGEVIGYLLAAEEFAAHNCGKDIFENTTEYDIYLKSGNEIIVVPKGNY